MISKSSRKNLARVPLVSVIIPNYNGLTYLGVGLKECLDSVIECNYPHVELIFVDNGSTDGSPIFVEENYRDKIVVIKNAHNLGCAEGYNTGIRASEGEYLALISNDMVVDRNWLEPIVKLMELDRRIGLAGCKRLRYGANRLLDGIGGDLYLCGRVKAIGAGEVDRGQYDANMDSLDFIHACIGGITRRRTIEQVGLFDPGFSPFFSEDVDLCFRMRKAGYKIVYVCDAVVWHRGSATLNGLSRYTHARAFIDYMMYRNRIRSNLIHFRLSRLLSAFLIDFVWFVVLPNPTSKILLLKAYVWNLKHIAVTLKKRLEIGPSPPYGCKYGVHLSLLSAIQAWIQKRHSP